MRPVDVVVFLAALLVVVGCVFLLSLVVGTLDSRWLYDEDALTCVDAQRAAGAFRARRGAFRTRAGCLAHLWAADPDSGACRRGARPEDVAYATRAACEHPPPDLAGAFYVRGACEPARAVGVDDEEEDHTTFQTVAACLAATAAPRQ